MITIHCLEYSRAVRLVWLMEDLKQPYNLVLYKRTENFRSPASLKKVHPLGKSPVVEDSELMLTESATCLRYLVDKYDDHAHRPEPGTREFLRHEELLDYVESSFAEVAMKLLLPGLSGQEPPSEAFDEMQKHYDHVEQQLPQEGLLFADAAMLADIQFSYLLANLSRMGFLESTSRLTSYWADLQKQSGYKAAVEKTGPMAPEG